MKISDLVKSLEKIKAKHGDLPIAFEVSDDDCCPIKKIHVKKMLADELGIKPKIEVRYIKPQVVKLHSRVTMSNLEIQYYCRGKFGMEQLKRRAIESVYDEILKGMKANGLVSISQYKDIYTNSTIYEGTCEIYKNK